MSVQSLGMLNGNSSTAVKTSSTVNGMLLANGTERIKRKARKPKEVVIEPIQPKFTPRKYKNARKSRSVYGRGLPKKGGAGGKGTWGKPGCEILEEEEDDVDPNDPIYDEMIDSRDTKLKVFDVEGPMEEIKKKLFTILLEYYEHGDTDDVLLSLEELEMTREFHLVVVTAIEVALEHKPSHREMTSVLLADLHGYFLQDTDYAKGYHELLTNLSDLILDTPEAPTIVGNFIARSIADECIPPKYVQTNNKFDCEHAQNAIKRAHTLLTMEHGYVRLDNVWGVGGGSRPVKLLVKKIVLLLEEFLSSADEAEASRCLTDLEVPHFHHEMVYEAVLMVIEKMDDRTSERICHLLKSLYDAAIVTLNQMEEGFLRIFSDMPQISLDVPLAYSILDNFVGRCSQAKIIGPHIVKKLPTRGRKRFVSEGDGGRVKDHH